jgi:uncharacterized membrane protein
MLNGMRDRAGNTGASLNAAPNQPYNPQSMEPVPPPSREPRPTFGSDFRRFFLRGLAGILPPLVTIAILVWVFNFVDGTIGALVTNGLRGAMASDNRRPEVVTIDDALTWGEPIDEFTRDGRRITREYKLLMRPDVPETFKAQVLWDVAFAKYRLAWIGLILGILLIYFVGYFLASFLGRSTWRIVERAFFRLPIVKAVYPHVKQVTDMVLSERTFDASAVVAVEFPRAGTWALGLVVGERDEMTSRVFSGEFIRVFVMMSPTPFSGHPIWVRRDEAIELPMTLDEAIRYCVSCGVVMPGGDKILPVPTRSPWRPKEESSHEGPTTPVSTRAGPRSG